MKFKFFTLLVLFSGLLTTKAQNSCQPPTYSFDSMSVVSGTGGVGSKYKFRSVLKGIDAVITIVKAQNATTNNTNIDASTGYSQAWQPFITMPSARTNTNDSSYMEFLVEFRTTASPQSTINQNCMAITVIDLDGTGIGTDFRETVKLGLPASPMGVNNSSISVYQDVKWLLFKSGVAQFLSIDTANTAAMGQFNFPSGIDSFYIRVGIVGPVTAGSTRQFSFYFKSFAALTTPLPVHLGDIEAKSAGADIHLNWISTHEVNLSHFDVYRSYNGVSYEMVGTVSGSGDQNGIHQYSFKDLNVINSQTQHVFYKLLMTDLNGKTLWSGAVVNELLPDESGSGNVSIYPNPSGSLVHLQSDPNLQINQVLITDVYGKTILEILDPENSNYLNFNVSGFENGLYWVFIRSVEGITSTRKFIKN